MPKYFTFGITKNTTSTDGNRALKILNYVKKYNKSHIQQRRNLHKKLYIERKTREGERKARVNKYLKELMEQSNGK